MRVGCPKEIKNHEYRVGLTPGSVREYVAHGHDVLVETGAGAGIGADDNAYRAAGATIAKTAQEVFAKTDMIVKVKEPQPSEWVQLREGQILYTYLHLAPDPAQTKGLIESGVTAVAYETVTDDRGGLPLLAPMSEVAGRLSIQAGATALQKANGGRGVLMGGAPGVRNRLTNLATIRLNTSARWISDWKTQLRNVFTTPSYPSSTVSAKLLTRMLVQKGSITMTR